MIPNTKWHSELDAECAALLAAQGAIMTIGGSPAQHFLVGDFALVGPHHVYWFAANGDTSADAHLLEFEEVHREGNEVHFWVSGQHVATIAAIDDTEVDDPDDFLIAWEIWQQVAPMRRMLLERSREECATRVLRGAGPKSEAPAEPAMKSKRKRRDSRGPLTRYSDIVADHSLRPMNAHFQSSPI